MRATKAAQIRTAPNVEERGGEKERRREAEQRRERKREGEGERGAPAPRAFADSGPRLKFGRATAAVQSDAEGQLLGKKLRAGRQEQQSERYACQWEGMEAGTWRGRRRRKQ